MTLNQSETRLLRQAARNRLPFVAAESHSGLGAKGGRVAAGSRDTEAVRSLVRKGLASDYSCTASRVTRAGYTVHVHTVQARLTDAGRAAVAALA